jgi:hypothetical protein
MKLGSRTVALWLVLAGALAWTSCTGGNNTSMTSSAPSAIMHSAMVTVNIGDDPDDQVAALEITISSISLTNSAGTAVPVLTTPVELELRHLAGTFQPIALTSVPAGTYTQANIQLSSAQITVLSPTTGKLVQQNVPVPSTPISIKFASPLVLTTQAATVNLDFNLASSVSIDASGNITFTPTIVATVAMVPSNTGDEDDAEKGEVEDVVGTISSISGTSFTLMLGQQSLTFATNSSTEFDGISGFSGLTKGMIVQVRAVTQADGTLLATKVEAEDQDDNDRDVEAQGLVVSTTGSPVTQFAIVVRDHSGDDSDMPSLGSTVTVNVASATQFKIDTDSIDLTNLSFTPTFDATSLMKGQNVETEGPVSSSTLTANKVRLKAQTLTGTVSGFTQNGNAATFTLTVASNSVFAMLSGQSTVTVFQQPSTRTRVTVANGATVEVRGLLFFTSGKYNLVAGRILQPWFLLLKCTLLKGHAPSVALFFALIYLVLGILRRPTDDLVFSAYAGCCPARAARSCPPASVEHRHHRLDRNVYLRRTSSGFIAGGGGAD